VLLLRARFARSPTAGAGISLGAPRAKAIIGCFPATIRVGQTRAVIDEQSDDLFLLRSRACGPASSASGSLDREMERH
jgi:hypothetical protein